MNPAECPASPEAGPSSYRDTVTRDRNEELDWATSSSSHIDGNVEYDDNGSSAYGADPSFSRSPFSPQPSTSMDFDDRVSPLDPNMSSAAPYSPSYALAHAHAYPMSPSSPLSPHSSPISSSANAVYSARSRLQTSGNRCKEDCDASDSEDEVHHVRLPPQHSRVHPADSHIANLASPLPGPSGMQHTMGPHSISSQAMHSEADHVPSPASPLRPPPTPADNYIVSSSTGHLDSVPSTPATPADLSNHVVLDSTVDSTSGISVHSSNIASAHMCDLEPSGLISTTGEVEEDDLDSLPESLPEVTSPRSAGLFVADDVSAAGPSGQNEMGNASLLESSQVAKILSHLEATQGLSLHPLPSLQQVSASDADAVLGSVAENGPSDMDNNEPSNCDDHQEFPDLPQLNEAGENSNDGKDGNQESPLDELSPSLCLGDDDLSFDEPIIDLELPVRNLRRNKNGINTENAKVSMVDFSDSWDMGKQRCEECGCFSEAECPRHRIQAIVDKPVPSRAWASLPAAYLAINKISGTSNFGVFAKKHVPKRTQFGPVEGVTVKLESWDKHEQELALLVQTSFNAFYKLDVSDENMSNWMRFVRPAKFFREQNLVLIQKGNALYFTTTRNINPRQELRVGYSMPYAESRNLPMFSTTEEDRKAIEEMENTWPCFECHCRFPSSELLQKHLNEHEKERGEPDGDELTKGKRRHNHFRKRNGFLTKKAKMEVSDGNVAEEEDSTSSLAVKKIRDSLTGSPKNQATSLTNGDDARHFRRRHDGKQSNGIKNRSSDRNLHCPHCTLIFDCPRLVCLHVLSHSKTKVDGQYGPPPDLLSMLPPDLPYIRNGAIVYDALGCQCPVCNLECTTLQELSHHVAHHGHQAGRHVRVINPAKPFKCDLCYKSFASEERLDKHMLVHGAEDSKPLQCDVCLKRFLNNSALACHIKIHTEERKNFECPICREAFEQVLSLKEHVHIHAVDGVFTCPHCSKVFGAYNLIRKHIRAFHSVRKFPCSDCGKAFPAQDKLRMHMLRHSDHREFLCANCGKQFKRKDKLKEHMRRMHSAEREARLATKPSKIPSMKKFVPKVSPTDYHRFIYKCHACLLGFKRRGMLVNHLAKRHPEISPNTVPELNLPILKTTRNYFCQYCEKIYKSSSKRKAHILKNHPGAELPMSYRRKGGVPELPGLPNPTFSQTVGSVTTHPHSCPWCHKQYASKAKLLQHQRKKHVDLLPENQQDSNATLNSATNDAKPEPVGTDKEVKVVAGSRRLALCVTKAGVSLQWLAEDPSLPKKNASILLLKKEPDNNPTPTNTLVAAEQWSSTNVDVPDLLVPPLVLSASQNLSVEMGSGCSLDDSLSVPRQQQAGDDVMESSSDMKYLADTQPHIVHIQEVDGVPPNVSFLSDYQLSNAQDIAIDCADQGIIIDASVKKNAKGASFETSLSNTDLLSQAMSDLNSSLSTDFRAVPAVTTSSTDQFLKLVANPTSHVLIAATPLPEPDKTAVDQISSQLELVVPVTHENGETSQLHQLLTASLPPTSPASPTLALPRGWAATYTSYTAR